MYPSLLITALMLASCFTTTSRGAAETQAQDAPNAPTKTPVAYPFPAVKEGISIKAGTDGDTKLTQLLNDFSRVTGNTLLITKEVRTLLENSNTGLNKSLDVPADRVYPIVESILVHNDFVLSLRSEREPRLIAVESVNAGRHSPLRNGAVVIPPQDLDAWSQHPEFLVTTVLDLPYTDVRTLSNSMRTLFTDQATQVIIPVGNSNSLIMTANGTELASLARILRTVDETARRETEEAHKLAPLQPAPKPSATKESPAKEPAKPSLENPPK